MSHLSNVSDARFQQISEYENRIRQLEDQFNESQRQNQHKKQQIETLENRIRQLTSRNDQMARESLETEVNIARVNELLRNYAVTIRNLKQQVQDLTLRNNKISQTLEQSQSDQTFLRNQNIRLRQQLERFQLEKDIIIAGFTQMKQENEKNREFERLCKQKTNELDICQETIERLQNDLRGINENLLQKDKDILWLGKQNEDKEKKIKKLNEELDDRNQEIFYWVKQSEQQIQNIRMREDQKQQQDTIEPSKYLKEKLNVGKLSLKNQTKKEFNPTFYATSTMSQSDVIQMKQAFDFYDIDGSGIITPNDLKQALINQKINATKQTAYNIIADYDEECIGGLDFAAFMRMLQPYSRKQSPHSKLQNLFKKYDQQKNSKDQLNQKIETSKRQLKLVKQESLEWQKKQKENSVGLDNMTKDLRKEIKNSEGKHFINQIKKNTHFPNLHTINLVNNRITDSDLEKIAQNSKNFPNLQQINLRNNQIGDAGLKALAENFKNLPNIRTIDLGYNKISSLGLKTLADNSKNLPNLRTIDLGDNQITDEGLKALADNSKNLPNLYRIDLGNNKITDAGLKALAENSKNLHNLNAIRLWANKITDAGLEALAENSKNLVNLHQINLGKNKITDDGLKAIVKNSKNLPNLTIKLWGTQVTQRMKDQILYKKINLKIQD